MKKAFLLLLLLTSTIKLKAQNTACSFIPPIDYSNLSRFTNRYQTIPDDGRKFVLNLNFLYALGTNGENNYDLNEDKMLKICAVANIKFNAFGIFFKYRGSKHINDSNFEQLGQNNLTVSTLRQKFIDLNLCDPNSINVFLVRGGNSAFDTDLILNSSNTDANNDRYYISHEFGHLLGLLHVEGTTGGTVIYDNLPSCIATHPNIALRKICKPNFQLNYDYYENVTRNPNDPKYNADIKGDYVTDTEASFADLSTGSYYTNYCRSTTADSNNEYSFENFNEDPKVIDNSGNINTSCFYCFTTATKYSYTTGNNFYTTTTNNISSTVPLGINTWQNIVNVSLTNCTQVGSGETYKIGTSLIHNIMSVAVTPSIFSAGQVQRMRERLLGNFINPPPNTPSFASLYNKLNLNEDETPDISVLYEPFSNSNSINNIGSATSYSKTYTPNNTNTGANVWNCGPFTMRFQTGFNCEFYNIAGQTILQAPFQQYNSICDGSIGIKIPILGEGIFYNMEPMCFGTYEPYTSGQIKSLNSLGASYFTQQELDEIKASDPDLYAELQSGKFHIIIKRTDSGFIDQKVIFKN